MEQLVRDYLAAWNATDARARRSTIDALFADDATYTDPLGSVATRDGIDAFIAAVQAQLAGVRFVLAGAVAPRCRALHLARRRRRLARAARHRLRRHRHEGRAHSSGARLPRQGAGAGRRRVSLSGVTTSDGVRLAYQDWGAGRPIVFVSAWGTHANAANGVQWGPGFGWKAGFMRDALRVPHSPPPSLPASAPASTAPPQPNDVPPKRNVHAFG